jgi:pimeloyl-ACP methyl ester carboxylesterase
MPLPQPRRLAALATGTILVSLLAAGQASAAPIAPAHAASSGRATELTRTARTARAAGLGRGGAGLAGRAVGGRPRPGLWRRPAAVEGGLPEAGGHRRAIRLGSVTIPPCAVSRLAWCTRIPVPLDYREPSVARLKLGFQWYPATRGHATGTILAVQGGPGFPTTDYAADYRGTFGPLLAHRNLLLVNLRGTGNSSAFLCRKLQNWKAADGISAYTKDTGQCGRQLNHTFRKPGGGWVHASDLYTTANAARDVALLLHRLRLGRVDFYGDSYGTFFGQVLTSRYASLLRSVTLDAAYPVSGTNPFYPHMIVTARHAFNISCDRSVACHRAAPGRAWATIGNLARYLRHHSVTGSTRTPGGRRVTERVTESDLIQMVNDAGADNGVYRELDPAARALLRAHDPAPLLRLTSQDIYTGTSGPVKEFNDGLYQATTCLDYPQPFSYAQSAEQRAVQYAQALSALPARSFAPFTVREWVTEPEEEFDACLDWPAPARPDPPIVKPGPYAPKRLPVLVLSGDLDSLTTPFEGRETARDMGPSARWILVHNDTHVNAMDDPVGCASGLVQHFIDRPARLRQLSASCAARTPEVRVVGSYPDRLGAVIPAAPRPGNQAGRTGRQLAAAGVAATGDAVWRWYYGDGVRGWGLRGGTFRFSYPGGSRVGIALHGVRWTAGTRVSGTVTWDQDSGRISARLTVTGPHGARATVRLRYRDYVRHSRAVLSGRSGGRRLAAVMPAP